MAPKNPESQIANPTQVGERANNHQVAHEQAGLALSHEANSLSQASPGSTRTPIDTASVSNPPRDTASSYLPSADNLLSGFSAGDTLSSTAGQKIEASGRTGGSAPAEQSRIADDRQSDNRQGAYEAYDEKAPTGFSPAASSLEKSASSKSSDLSRGADLSRSASNANSQFMGSITNITGSEARVGQVIGNRSDSDIPAFAASTESADSRTSVHDNSKKTDVTRASFLPTNPGELRESSISLPVAKPTESRESPLPRPTANPSESRASSVSRQAAKPAESRLSSVSRPAAKPAESRVSQVSNPALKPTESRVSQVSPSVGKAAESRVSQVSQPVAKLAESHVAQTSRSTTSSATRGQESVQKANHPESHAASHPEPAHAASHPEPARAASHPEPAHAASHPEPAHAASHPEPAHAASHAELAHAPSPSETTHAAHQSETMHGANHPESAHAANHPDSAHATSHTESMQPDKAAHLQPVHAKAHPEPIQAAETGRSEASHSPIPAHSDESHLATMHTGTVKYSELGQTSQRSSTNPDSRRISQIGPAPVIDKAAQKEETEFSTRSMQTNQQSRTSQTLESERELESSRKTIANKERQTRNDDEEDRSDFGKKGALSKAEGSRGKERGFSRGEGGESLNSFARNADGSTMAAIEQKSSGRLSGAISTDQFMQQNNMLQPDGTRSDFGVNAAGNIVNLKDGKGEGVSSHSRHNGGAESSGKAGSDATSVSSETSKTSTGLSNSQGTNDVSNLNAQASADRSIFSGTPNNPANIASGLQSTTGAHSGASKGGHSSKEPGVGQTDPSSSNNTGSTLNGGQMLSSLGNQAQSGACTTQHKTGQEPGQLNSPNSSSNHDTMGGVGCNGNATITGQQNQPGQSDPVGLNNPVSQTHPSGQSIPIGQVNSTGQTDPIAQTNPAGSADPISQNAPNGQVDPKGKNPNSGEPNHSGQPGDCGQHNRDGGDCPPVFGGDQSGPYGQPTYGWSDNSGHRLVGILGSILVGLGEGLGAGNGHLNKSGSGIPIEYGAGNLSQFNKSPGTIHVGDNGQPEISNGGQVNNNPQILIIEPTQSPIEPPQNIVSQPPETVLAVNNSSSEGSASIDQSAQTSGGGSQTIDSSTYVGGVSTGEGSGFGHSPGVAGDGSDQAGGLGSSDGSPLKAFIRFDAGDDQSVAGSSANGSSSDFTPNGISSDLAPNGGGDPFKFGNLNPLADPADSGNFANPKANGGSANPNSGNQIISDPSNASDYQSGNGTDPLSNQIPLPGITDSLDPISGNQNVGQVPVNSGIGVDDYQLPDASSPLLAYSSIPVPGWIDDNLVVPDPGLPSATDWQSPQSSDEEEQRHIRHFRDWDSEMPSDNSDHSHDRNRKEIVHSEYQDDGYANSAQRSEIIIMDNVGGVSMPDDAAIYFGINENAEIENQIIKRREEIDFNRRLEQERIKKEDEIKKANIISQKLAAQRANEEEEEQARRLLALMQAQEEQARKDNQQSRYLVKRGDTLEKIAQLIFQDISLVPLIYAINKRLIGKQLVEGKALYTLKENIVLLLPSNKMVREWRQNRRFSLYSNDNAAGYTNGGVENDIAKQRRLNIEKYLGPLGSVPISAQRLSVGVRLGDTLRSIAMKHPELDDINLWPLLAQCNSLSTAVDNKGVPVTQLKRGTLLLLPTESEIADYRMRLLHATQPVAPRNALQAAVKRSQTTSIEEDCLISESDFELAICETVNLSLEPRADLTFSNGHFIEKLGESCRIVQTSYGESGSGRFCSQLEVLVRGIWLPILSYEAQEGASFRYEYSVDGRRSTMAINLPVEAVVQLMHNDLHTNWHDYRKKFLRRKPLDQERLNLVQEQEKGSNQKESDRAAARYSI